MQHTEQNVAVRGKKKLATRGAQSRMILVVGSCSVGCHGHTQSRGVGTIRQRRLGTSAKGQAARQSRSTANRGREPHTQLGKGRLLVYNLLGDEAHCEGVNNNGGGGRTTTEARRKGRRASQPRWVM